MPPRFFHHRRFNLVALTTVLYNAAIQAAWTLMPIFFQVVKGASATVSGLLVLPFVIGTTISSIATGRLISRTGRYKWAALTGQVLTAIAFVLYASMTAGTSRLQATAYLAIAGLGIGCVLNPLVVIVQNTVDARDLGAATAATGLFRSLGSAFGAAVGLGVYSGHLARNLRSSHLTYLPKAAQQGAPAAIRVLPVPARHALIGAFEHALHSAFAFTAPTVIAAIALTSVMRDLSHDQPAVADSAPLN
jgi:predicted MFS family arabinose efflux permease